MDTGTGTGAEGTAARTGAVGDDGAPGRFHEEVGVEIVEPLPITRERRSFKRGEIVVREGDPSNGCCYRICSGAWAVIVGSSCVQILHREGEIFGERSVLTGDPRNATVEAGEDGELEVIQFHGAVNWVRLAETDPALAQLLVSTLAAHLNASNREIVRRRDQFQDFAGILLRLIRTSLTIEDRRAETIRLISLGTQLGLGARAQDIADALSTPMAMVT